MNSFDRNCKNIYSVWFRYQTWIENVVNLEI